VANKREKRTQGCFVVKVTYIPVPDAEARLARAIDLLLKSDAMNIAKSRDNADSNRDALSRQIIVKDLPINDEGKPLDIQKDSGRR
jgi:hypothetical protein